MTDAKDLLLVWIGQAGVNIAERFWSYAYETLGIPVPIKAGEIPSDIDKMLDKKLEMTEFYTDYEIEEARRMFFYNLLDDKDRASNKQKKYIPRSIFIDLEAQPIRSFHERNSHIFPKDDFVYNTFGSHSMWARAKRIGTNLKPYFLDRIQSLIQMRAIQNLEGIVIIHATGGGAGSGLLDSVFEVLQDKFPKVPTLTFSIFPSRKLSGNVIEAYNTIYASNTLLANASASVMLDNDKIIDLVREKYQIESPTYEDINMIISRLIFSVIMQMAMPGAIIRADFNKIFTNLVPYKYMKFLMTSLAPFKFDEFSQNTTEDLVEELTDDNNYMVDVNFGTGRYVSTMYFFMGKLGPEVKTPLRIAKENMNFMPWIPTGMFIGITPREKMTLDGMPLLRQGIALANNSAIRFVFHRIMDQFQVMFKKGAFMHHFRKENIEAEQELKQAAANITRMMKFYEIAEKSTTKKRTAKS